MPRRYPILLLLLLTGTTAHAQSATVCSIAVRMLAVSDAASSDEGPRMSSFLEDVRDQLTALPFKGYDVVDFKETQAAFGQKATVDLRGTQDVPYSVSVLPHGRGQGKVQVTVDWRDGNRKSLLSTKMRVPEGENVVLGTDNGPDTPMLVAIKVSC